MDAPARRRHLSECDRGAKALVNGHLPVVVPGPTTMDNSRRTDAPVGRTVVLQGGFRLASRRPGSKTVKGMGSAALQRQSGGEPR